MKKLIIVNGTMGVGKTTTCQVLLDRMESAVFLDGDWCWNMKPFIVNEETKAMVMKNIIYMLRSYLNCSVYKNVVFCWVLHKESILDKILEGIKDCSFETYIFTLTAEPKALEARIQRDIDNEVRQPGAIEKSLERHGMYGSMKTRKIDVSTKNPTTVAKEIIKLCRRSEDEE